MSEETARTLFDTLGRRNRRLADRECVDCGKFFRPKGANSKYCSRSCMWKNNGKNQGPKPATPLSTYLRRFWSRVNKDQDCWLWTGSKNEKGYGRFTANGKRYQAHCFAYLLVHGEIPADLELDHLCRMPPCVRVDHLEAVTHQENLKRGVQGSKTRCKGGHYFNEQNTRIDTNGNRACRACDRIRARAYRSAKAD